MSNNLQFTQRRLSAPMLFSALPDSVQQELRDQSPLRSFDDGQLIQQRGDAPKGFWLIDQGSVAVGQFLRDGEFRGVALLGPGDSWGELAMFAERPRVVDAVARTPCRLHHIAAVQFEAALQRDPGAMRSLLSALSLQLQEVLDVVAGIRRGSAPARVAGMLLTLSEKAPDPMLLDISQQELGELLGLTRATVNAALRDYQSQGLIRRHYARIEVQDLDGLALAALS